MYKISNGLRNNVRPMNIAIEINILKLQQYISLDSNNKRFYLASGKGGKVRQMMMFSKLAHMTFFKGRVDTCKNVEEAKVKHCCTSYSAFNF